MDRVIREPNRLKKLVIVVTFLERALALLVALVLGIILLISAHSQRATDLVVDCTTPQHQCYDQLQRNSEQAIKRLEDIIVTANLCTTVAQQPPDIVAVERCINAKLRALERIPLRHSHPSH